MCSVNFNRAISVMRNKSVQSFPRKLRLNNLAIYRILILSNRLNLFISFHHFLHKAFNLYCEEMGNCAKMKFL